MMQDDEYLSMRDLRRTELECDLLPTSPRKTPRKGGGEVLSPPTSLGSRAIKLQRAQDATNCAAKMDYFIPVVDDDTSSSVRQTTDFFGIGSSVSPPPTSPHERRAHQRRDSAKRLNKTQKSAREQHDSTNSNGESRPRYKHLYKHSRVRFTDHAPQAFWELRKMAGISDQQFTSAFGLQGHMREAGSAGKSGDVFYFTQNMQFLVKTLPTHEVATLKELLPHYLEHIRANPSSLVLRFLGLYTVQLPFSQQVMFFVVMKNVLLGENGEKIHERFDLKGNIDTNRRTGLPKGVGLRLDIDIREDIEKDVARTWASVMKDQEGRTRGKGGKGGAGGKSGKSAAAAVAAARSKEMRFGGGSKGQYNSQLLLSADNRRNLVAQLEADMGFLETHGLIDYSLLLGVHHADQQPAMERSASFDATGLLSPPSSQFMLYSPMHQKNSRARQSHDDLELVSAGVAGRVRSSTRVDSHTRAGSGGGSEANPQEFPRDLSISVDAGAGHGAHANTSSGLSFLRSLDALPATDLSSVYYVGIIDILAKYSWKWAVQRYALCLFVCKSPKEVTAIPAGQYADRLLDFVDNVLLGNNDVSGTSGAGGASGSNIAKKKKKSSTDRSDSDSGSSSRAHHRTISEPVSPMTPSKSDSSSGSSGGDGGGGGGSSSSSSVATPPPGSSSPRNRKSGTSSKKAGKQKAKGTAATGGGQEGLEVATS
jgi:hypothetical protein